MRLPSLCRTALGLVAATLSMTALAADSHTPTVSDPFGWLEDVGGEKPLAWARQQNEIAQREIEASPDFKPVHDRILAILDSKERIPYVSKRGAFYYNFWRDAQHVRGLWRRTTLAEFRRPEPAWETVLDLDALSTAEGENWVWKGTDWLEPEYDRCLLSLSRGGADAVVVREFDPIAKTFVAGGFVLPEAKSSVSWRNRDSLFVGTNFGPDALTDSGYPRLVKQWQRGTPLGEARLVFEGVTTDVSVAAYTTVEPGFRREFARRGITFFSGEYFIRLGDKFTKIDVPADAEPSTYREYITVTLRTDWTTGGKVYPAGALIAMPWDRFLEGERGFAVLYQPGPRKSLAGYSATRHHLLVNELDQVRNRLYVLTPEKAGTWSRAPLPAPEFGSLSASAVDDETDDFWLNVDDFLTPPSLNRGTVGKPGRELLKQLPAFFATDGLEVSQHEALSADGTRVPYFQVARRGLKLDGTNPTLLYGYGGFEISMTPGYRAGVGAAWLERGGVFVLANIRGGGEFGPA